MPDNTDIFINCLVALICFGLTSLIAAGGAFWLISRQNANEKDKAPSTQAAAVDRTPISAAPGSVGAVSQEIGYDVRDLIMMGFTQTEILAYTREEIMSVVDGKRSLDQLRSDVNPSEE